MGGRSAPDPRGTGATAPEPVPSSRGLPREIPMATKKYLSLEEASDSLGMSTEQTNKLRERGELRGFADRGTWKFKADDVAEFARTREVTSDPDVPLMDDSVFADDEADELADQPTLVRGRDVDRSDSDVRLVIDDDLGATVEGQDLADSDSDVRLIGAGASRAGLGADSDSDVSLVSDSSTAGGSDSDVRLIGDDDDGADSDVALVRGDSSAASRRDGDSVISLRDEPSSIVGGSVLDEDAGDHEKDSQLTLAADSGIALDLAGDSSVVLEGAGSGVSLNTADSGISLTDDEDAADAGSSVILLGDDADSGISLSDEASGIGLGGAADSGIALDFDDDEDPRGGATQPMMKAGGPAARDEGPATEADMAVLAGLGEDAGADSEFELATDHAEESTGTDTSVILFEDDDDEDDFADTAAVATAGGASSFELDEVGFDEFDEDEPAVSAEVLVDDEADELDVFEASDDDFDDEFESGVSHAEFAPTVAGPPPAEFDTATVAGLAVAAALLLFLGLPMMFDLVRSLWGYNEPNIYSDTLLGALSSIYG